MNKIRLEVSKDDPVVGYVYLENEEKQERKVNNTIDLANILPNYKGVPVYLDFDQDGELIGIEIVG